MLTFSSAQVRLRNGKGVFRREKQRYLNGTTHLEVWITATEEVEKQLIANLATSHTELK